MASEREKRRISAALRGSFSCSGWAAGGFAYVRLCARSIYAFIIEQWNRIHKMLIYRADFVLWPVPAVERVERIFRACAQM